MEPEAKSQEAKSRRRRRRRKPKSMVSRASDMVTGRESLFPNRKKRSSRKSKSKSIGETSAFEETLNKTSKSFSRAISPIGKAAGSSFSSVRQNWWVQFSLGVGLGLLLLSLLLALFLFFFTNTW